MSSPRIPSDPVLSKLRWQGGFFFACNRPVQGLRFFGLAAVREIAVDKDPVPFIVAAERGFLLGRDHEQRRHHQKPGESNCTRIAFFAFQTASVLALATKNPRAGLRAERRAGAHAGKRKDEAGRMSQTR